MNEKIIVDPHEQYYVEFTKDNGFDQVGDRTQVIGTEYMNLLMNECVKEITEEEFNVEQSNKYDFEPNEKYYIKVITNDYPSILEFGKVYEKLGKDIPTYCTKNDIEILSKEEYDKEISKKIDEEENPFKQIVDNLIEDKKYIKREGDVLVMDDGFQRQIIGRDLKETKSYLDNLKEEVIMDLVLKQSRKATERLVESFQENNYIYTTRDDDKSEMWIYDDGIYISEGKTFIREFCRKILMKAYTGHLANEVINKIEADTYINKEDFFMVNNVYEIPILDGILDLKTRKISSFTPDKIFFSKLPLNYVPEQQCPKIDKFFKDVLAHPEDIKVMYEIFGFLLLKEYLIEKAVMFNGFGRNGKGKTLKLMENFVGTQNCCNVGLTSMRKDNFDLEDLFGKLVNAAGDTGRTALKDTGCFKELVGRDGVNLPRKFKRTIRLVNYAKHIFACNELPIVYDDTDGFWTKWVLLDFPYKFIPKEEYDLLNEDERRSKKIIDIDIINTISTQDELNGLLIKALDGLDTILKNNDFSDTQGTNEIKKSWKRKASSFTAFCEDCISENYELRVTKRKLKKAYFDYCKKYKLISTKASDKQIKEYLESNYSVEEGRPIINEERILVWEGIKLNNHACQRFQVPRGISNSTIGLKRGVCSANSQESLESFTNFGLSDEEFEELNPNNLDI